MSHEKALLPGERTPFTAAGTTDFSGHWVDQMESTMELTINGSDVIGEYTSSSSARDPNGDSITVTLEGYVAGDSISFMVLWPGGSITSWVGQMVDDQTRPRIRTLWHLITEIPDPDEPKELWKSTFAGADEFIRHTLASA